MRHPPWPEPIAAVIYRTRRRVLRHMPIEARAAWSVLRGTPTVYAVDVQLGEGSTVIDVAFFRRPSQPYAVRVLQEGGTRLTGVRAPRTTP